MLPEIGFFQNLNRVERSIYSFAVWALLAVVVTLLAFQAAGVHFLSGEGRFEDYLDLAGLGGGNNSAFVAFSIYYLALEIRGREIAALALLAAILEWHFWPQGAENTMWAFFATGGWVTGCVFSAGILFRAIVSKQDRPRAVGLLSMILVMSSLALLIVVVLRFVTFSHPLVYDGWGLLVDGTWGFQPAMKIAQWQTAIPHLEHVILFFYVKLAVWQAMATVLVIRFPERSYNNVFAVSVVMGMMSLGLFYHILPMVGIDVVLGGVKIYPFGPEPNLSAPAQLVRMPDNFPRTCAPSMHTAWILAAFFAMCRIHRAATAVGLVVVFFTLLGTMNRLVGHYLVDLFAALPLVVAGQALTAWSTDENRQWRIRAGVFGLLGCGGLLLSIRWFPKLMQTAPWLFAGIQMALLVASLWLENKLARTTIQSLRMDEDEVE